MSRYRKPSESTRLVLQHLTLQPQYGYALMKITGLKSGTLYPILMRLKDRGLLSARWEVSEKEGRPPRQSYRLTTNGQLYAKEVLDLDDVLPQGKGIKT